MKTKIILTCALSFIILGIRGQVPIIELTFIASNNLSYLQMDSIKVMNRTQGGDTILYWPDTSLILDFQVGAQEINQEVENFKLFQNYPNPVKDQTTLTLFVPERDNVNLKVSDLSGRILLNTSRILDQGFHSFGFSSGKRGLFFVTAQWREKSNSIKIVFPGSHQTGRNSLEYIGSRELSPKYKATEEIQDFIFNIGDELLYIGYGNGFQSGMLGILEESKTIRFQFATNTPCMGTPNVEYEGQTYNTIQIFSQCWLKENLNVGVIIPGTENMTNNGIVEKYCYNNEPDSCTKYGGLYQWDEMMQYNTGQGIQGICPEGWHLPTDEEWKVLEGAVDSQYGIGDQIWDNVGAPRGYDAGTNLKSLGGWQDGGNGEDLYGFSGIPGGVLSGDFYDILFSGSWWSSTELIGQNEVSSRFLHAPNSGVSQVNNSKNYGFSVRCIRDDSNSPYKLLTGEVSKTWKLFREGVCMALGPNPDDPYGWWSGLTNNGERPCSYQQEFTFYYNGTYEFNDNGVFWGEYGVFDGQWNYEICFEALPENMINLYGDDVSAWLSGMHAFTYDPSISMATATGLGAWIGIPKLTTYGETVVPVSSVTFGIEITQETGYDLMTISFDWGDAGYWHIIYVNYSDPSLEPELVLEEPPYGEDLPDLTPDEMWNTFETSQSFVLLDTASAYPGNSVAANSIDFTMGVADPAGGANNVGQYDKMGMYHELQFQMDYDIQFDNFTTVSVDVYMPSSNNYSGPLTKDIGIIIAEASQTEQWWTDHIQYDATAAVLDEWVTYTFNLSEPTSGPGQYIPYERSDLDFFAITLGGAGHEDPGTFYIRNLVFE